jgi:hypothetical protein
VDVDNIEAFVFEDRMRMITEGKVMEYHIMDYYRHKIRQRLK